MKRIEFIESYIKVDDDYQWNDNHGKLIRCEKCKYWQPQEYGVVEVPVCKRLMEEFTGQKGGQFFAMDAEDYCSQAEAREEHNGKNKNM